MGKESEAASADALSSVDHSSSADDIMSQLLQREEETTDTEEVSEIETEEDEEPEVESEETESEQEEETEEEAEESEAEEDAEIDAILNLPPDKLKELAKRAGVKSLGRFAELTWRAKSAEEKLESAASTATPAPEPSESRFFKDVKSAEELTREVSKLKRMVRDTERIIDDHEDYGPNDEFEVDGKTFTKTRLRALRDELHDAIDEAAPYKAHQFQRAGQLEAEEAALNDLARKEVPEIEDGETEVGRNFKALNDSQVFKDIRKKVPDAAPGIELLLAHYCRSKFGAKVKPAAPAQTATSTKAKPPSRPTGVAAAPTPAKSKERKLEEAEKRFGDSGSAEDLARVLMSKE